MASAVSLFVVYKFLVILTTPWVEQPAYKLGIIDENGKILRKENTLKTAAEKSSYTIFHRLIFNIKKIIEKLPFGKTRIASYATALYLIKEHIHNDSAYELLESKFLEILKEKDPQSFFEYSFSKPNFLALNECMRPLDVILNTPLYRVNGVILSEGEVTATLDGLGQDLNPEDVDQDELEMGIQIELEHTRDLEVATRIALDHLYEIPDYYTRLEKMEKEAKKNKPDILPPLKEDAPANNVGGGAIGGANGDPPGPHGKFAGCDVFRVSSSTFNRCLKGKKKYARWNHYLMDEDESDVNVKNYAKKHHRKTIILQNDTDGSMLYLRRMT